MDIISYILSRKYTDMSIIGLGAIKGANCEIQNIVHQDGVNTVTFKWVGTDGTTKTRDMTVYDGTPIYVWESGNTYHYGDLVIYASAFYRCIVENSDIEFDNTKWNEIGSPDGNYDIVETKTLLPPRFTSADRKLYFVIDECIFYLWDGLAWVALNHVVQETTMPNASATYLGKIYQYIGVTNVTYTHGYFYECVSDGLTPATYSWINIDIQPSNASHISFDNTVSELTSTNVQGAIDEIDYTVDRLEIDKQNVFQVYALPLADATEINKIYQYIGFTDTINNIIHGYFYECVSDGQTPATYSWVNVDIQKNTTLLDTMGWYNVLDYGLVGDGVTDNVTALRSLLNLVPSGATIYFPSGVYGLSDGVLINKTLSFIGNTHKINTRTIAQQDSVIKYIGNNDNVSLLYRNSMQAWDVSFENLSFDGNSFSISENTDAWDGTTYPYPFFKETTTHTGINGLNLAYQKDSGNSTVRNCMFYGFSGFAVSQSRYKEVIECGFQHCAVCIQDMFDSEIHNCYISNCGTAVRLVKADNVSSWASINISDCWIDALSQHFMESLDVTDVVIMTDNVWVDMVDGAAFYFPLAMVSKSAIQGHFGRIAMSCAGLPVSARTEALAPFSDFFYARQFMNNTFDIDIGETVIGSGNNPSGKCISRYFYPVNWSMTNCIIDAPEITITELMGKGNAYNTKITNSEGIITINNKLQYLNGVASGSGSPVGVSGYTAPSVGYHYYDTTNKIMYRSIGNTNLDWEMEYEPIQFTTMPTASANYLNKIVQYIGDTTANYVNGYWYRCVYDSTSQLYSWESIIGSAAQKDFTSNVRPNNYDLVESHAVYSAINSALSSIYVPRGDLSCAELTADILIPANVGNVYTMSDSGTTSALFINGAGHPIATNDNVGIIRAGADSIMFNLMGNAFDLHDYQTKELETPLTIGGVEQTEVEGALNALNNAKSDKATTLAGYGITNAYTKTETNTEITNAIADLDATDTAVAGSYVTAVSEVDGVISVTREAADVTPTSASTKMLTSGGAYTEFEKKLEKISALPTASATNLDTIYLLASTQTGYLKGGIYQCVSDGESTPTYSWQLISSADMVEFTTQELLAMW